MEDSSVLLCCLVRWGAVSTFLTTSITFFVVVIYFLWFIHENTSSSNISHYSQRKIYKILTDQTLINVGTFIYKTNKIELTRAKFELKNEIFLLDWNWNLWWKSTLLPNMNCKFSIWTLPLSICIGFLEISSHCTALFWLVLGIAIQFGYHKLVQAH